MKPRSKLCRSLNRWEGPGRKFCGAEWNAAQVVCVTRHGKLCGTCLETVTSQKVGEPKIAYIVHTQVLERAENSHF